MAKKQAMPFKIPSAKAEDQPATRKMLWLVRDELKSEIRSLDLKVEQKIDQLSLKMDAAVSDLRADIVRTQILVEEQNSNNRIVLEGLQALWQRQDRIEKRPG